MDMAAHRSEWWQPLWHTPAATWSPPSQWPAFHPLRWRVTLPTPLLSRHLPSTLRRCSPRPGEYISHHHDYLHPSLRNCLLEYARHQLIPEGPPDFRVPIWEYAWDRSYRGPWRQAHCCAGRPHHTGHPPLAPPSGIRSVLEPVPPSRTPQWPLVSGLLPLPCPQIPYTAAHLLPQRQTGSATGAPPPPRQQPSHPPTDPIADSLDTLTALVSSFGQNSNPPGMLHPFPCRSRHLTCHIPMILPYTLLPPCLLSHPLPWQLLPQALAVPRPTMARHLQPRCRTPSTRSSLRCDSSSLISASTTAAILRRIRDPRHVSHGGWNLGASGRPMTMLWRSK